MGLVTCLGHDKPTVTQNLRGMRHGIRVWPALDTPISPIRVAAPLPDYETGSKDPEDWSFPQKVKLRLEQLRSLSPHGLYAMHAMADAISDAGLTQEQISNPRTGLFTASAGSVRQTHFHLDKMMRVGPMRCSPLGIIASIAGTLTFNLAAFHQIRGSSSGFVSACASSGHALGYACDEILLNRQDRMFVVGAEDFTVENILPFAAMRVLSVATDPNQASRPFDTHRDGFVGTGGSVVLVLEESSIAQQRGATVYGYIDGWGQSTDGYHVAASHPQGDGLLRAMQNALNNSGKTVADLDYINAHATSTQHGDASECHALRALLNGRRDLAISSTKGLTGHALSLSSIMEAAFCMLALDQGFMPGSAGIQNLDPVAQDLPIITQTIEQRPQTILSNSSGFGGANVSLVLSGNRSA